MVNGIHETKPDKVYETKRNFTFDETKRNETKFRCILCFAKQAKFRETIFLFRFVSCFAKHKNGSEMETLFTSLQLSKLGRQGPQLSGGKNRTKLSLLVQMLENFMSNKELFGENRALLKNRKCIR
jgi:hypothetical protein